MKATIQYVQERFRHFNELMFGGELPEVPIGLTHSKRMLGYCSCRKESSLFGLRTNRTFSLKINNLVDLPESCLEDIIIHEMIHLYIGVKRLDDLSAHGPLFRKMMTDLNSRFDRHISVSVRLDSEKRDQLARKDHKRQTIVAAVEFTDGRYGFKVLPKVRKTVMQFAKGMKQVPNVKSLRIVVTSNPFFYDYPRSGRLAVHIVNEETLNTALEGSAPCVLGALN